jgi:ABC-2 type transport system ATP-binding protein
MRQRAKLAQALVHDPRLLFLDEPTNGLDPLGRVAMLELIREIARLKQVGIILSSHLLPDVEHVCERVILINHGRIVRQGVVSELTRREQHRFAVRVKEDAAGFAQHLRDRGYAVEFSEDGKILVEFFNDGGPGDLFRVAQQCGAQIRQLEPVRQQLEEVFLQAVGGETQIT